MSLWTNLVGAHFEAPTKSISYERDEGYHVLLEVVESTQKEVEIQKKPNTDFLKRLEASTVSPK